MTVPVPPEPGAGSGATTATAGIARRGLAWLLDGLLFIALVAGVYVALAERVPGADAFGDDACELLTDVYGQDRVAGCIDVGDDVLVLDSDDVLVQTGATLLYFALFVILQGGIGASPGKLLVGVRVVTAEGRICGIGRSLGRTLLWAVDGAPWIIPLVGPVLVLTTPGNRRIGDMAAGTYVVHARDVGRPVRPDAAAPPEGQRAWGAAQGPATGPMPWEPGWGEAPTGPPVAGTAQPTPTPPTPGPPVDPAANLDIRSLDVPDPTGRVDEAAPAPEADPDWWRGPEADPAAGDPAGDEPWDPTGGAQGTGDDPSAPARPPAWEPPTTAFDDPAPEADPSPGPIPGGSPVAPDATTAGPLDDHGRTPEATTPLEVPDAGASGDLDPGAAGPSPFVAPGAEGPADQDPALGQAGAQSPGESGAHAWEASQRPAEPVRYQLPPPQWDAARNTYLQWDPNAQVWLQWDALAQRWEPIDS